MIERKDQSGWEELIIETVVKGTGKENAWRRLLIIGIFKFMKGSYTKEEIELRLLVKIVNHFLRASLFRYST